MMNRIRLLFCALLSVLLLPACSSDAPPVRSVAHEQAIELNQRALRAFQRGEYQAAADLYDSALRLDSAIENIDGIGLNLINLAKVNQTMGKLQVAQLYLDRLLMDSTLEYPAGQLVTASVQSALLQLQIGNVAAAKVWAEKADRYCSSDCSQEGLLANLHANISLQSGEGDEALRWGERAVSLNKGETQLEYANALRVLAQAKLSKGQFAPALALLNEVIVIDKALGVPVKIRHDLMLLSRVYEKMGNTALASQFRERAERITSATSAK
jgi:tetratricopeptide (TPR) repeat protein